MNSSKNIRGGGRDSNFELYRIVAMLLIIAHHFVVNSGILDKAYEAPLSANSIFLFLFGAWGKTGINCFMMITGYFMCICTLIDQIKVHTVEKFFLDYIENNTVYLKAKKIFEIY